MMMTFFHRLNVMVAETSDLHPKTAPALGSKTIGVYKSVVLGSGNVVCGMMQI
jgi:hypothetical protein